MYLKVNYARAVYYLDQQDKRVLNQSLKALKKEELKALKIKDEKQFFDFLYALYKKKLSNPYFNELSFRELLKENLLSNGKELAYENTKLLLGGINYCIYRQADTLKCLDLLDKIIQKNTTRLSYNYLEYTPDKKINLKNVTGASKNLFRDPYFWVSGTSIKCLPVILDKVLTILNL